MKFFLLISVISLLSLCSVFADNSDNISLNNDDLDVVDLAKDDMDTKTSEAQRKRDSGYSYTRPGRLSSSRHELSAIRGRIVTKYPNSQTIRPFNRYGPPKQMSQQFVKPSDQYAPQHLHIGGHRQQQQQQQHRYPHTQQSGPVNQGSQLGGGQMQQGVPSPIRYNDFIEPSPIASQNNEPFNSNSANYLPPRNQKLPGYLNTHEFSNHFQPTSNQHKPQNFNSQHQSQRLVQGQFEDQPQISDAALFLTQNAQAISQLYETPATNLNYEPIHDSQGSVDQSQNPNNQFQTFNDSPQRLESSRGFPGNLPSYASGYLDSQQTLQQIQSLEKDRLIVQLQRALTQGNSGNPSDTSARYAQNHQVGSYIQTFGTQINPSIGQQPDKFNNVNAQRPFAVGNNQAFGQESFVPVTGTTTSGLPVTYGLPSPTPATQFPSTTATSTTTSVASQRPLPGATSDGSSQVGTSVLPSGPSLTFPFPQYGGFVPNLIGPNLVPSYPPTYGTSFLGSGSVPVTPVHTSGSSSTHFTIPIPTIPSNTQGTSSSSSPPISQSPQTPSHQHPVIPVHTIPVQHIQPINPIAATPIHPVFPVAPTVTQVHPVQSPVASGHHNYGIQSTQINPIIIKPAKPGVYPIYYYPNVYQVQKPTISNIPWSYAPSYAQVKPQQIWK